MFAKDSNAAYYAASLDLGARQRNLHVKAVLAIKCPRDKDRWLRLAEEQHQGGDANSAGAGPGHRRGRSVWQHANSDSYARLRAEGRQQGHISGEFVTS